MRLALVGLICVALAVSTGVLSKVVAQSGPAVVTLQPTCGPVGTKVTVNGSNFYPPPYDVQIDFDSNGSPVAPSVHVPATSISASGAFSWQITIPAVAPSTTPYAVVASQVYAEVTAPLTGSANFFVPCPSKPPPPQMLTVSPTCGFGGTVVQVHGAGFTPPPQNSDVKIFFGTDPNPNVASPSTPNVTVRAQDVRADGTFDASVTPNLPNRAAPYAVTATQNIFAAEFSQYSATAYFRIPCTALALNPTCGSVGERVSIRGSGFQPRLAVMIAFTPSATGKPDAVVVPQADTTFATVVNVPQLAQGAYIVEATQTAVATAVAIPPLVVRAPFQIPCINLKAVIVLKPAVGPPGTVTTVVGTGFPVGAVVKLSWSQGIRISTASITIDQSHGFQVTLLIYPHDELGLRHLNAGPDLTVTNAPLFNIATADFLVVPGAEQPRDFSWRR